MPLAIALKRYRRERVHFRLVPITFLAPVVVLFAVFVIWPIIGTIWLSFHDWGGFGPRVWVGFKNYIRLFQDFRFWTAVQNNLYWLVFSLLAPVGGLVLAMLLNQQIRGIRAIKSLFFFPFVINLVVVGLIFSWFFNSDFGLLSLILQKTGILRLIVGLRDVGILNGDVWGQVSLTKFPILSNEYIATFGIIISSLWPQIAYCMILYITGLTSLDVQVIEAGSIDGAKGFGMFWHIILPQLRPATFIATVVTIIGALRSFDLIAIMTAGGPFGQTTVLAYLMYQESIFNFNFGYGSAIATFLFMIMNVYIVYFLCRIAKNER